MMLLSSDSDSDSDASAVNIKTVRKMNMMFLQLNNSIAAHYFTFTSDFDPSLSVPSLLSIYNLSTRFCFNSDRLHTTAYNSYLDTVCDARVLTLNSDFTLHLHSHTNFCNFPSSLNN